MVKINTLLSRQSQVQSVLEENNLGLEQEFRVRLKTAELESVRMENRIEELREEKKRALQGLVEAEYVYYFLSFLFSLFINININSLIYKDDS